MKSFVQTMIKDCGILLSSADFRSLRFHKIFFSCEVKPNFIRMFVFFCEAFF